MTDTRPDQIEHLFDPPTTMPRPALTLSEAVEACAVSKSTIRRALDAGQFPDAYREHGSKGPETGQWRIPVTSLIQAGFTLNAPKPEPAASVSASHDIAVREGRSPALNELADIESRIRLEGERDKWEAIAAERGQSIEHLKLALRALPSGAVTPLGLTSRPDRVPTALLVALIATGLLVVATLIVVVIV